MLRAFLKVSFVPNALDEVRRPERVLLAEKMGEGTALPRLSSINLGQPLTVGDGLLLPA